MREKKSVVKVVDDVLRFVRFVCLTNPNVVGIF